MLIGFKFELIGRKKQACELIKKILWVRKKGMLSPDSVALPDIKIYFKPLFVKQFSTSVARDSESNEIGWGIQREKKNDPKSMEIWHIINTAFQMKPRHYSVRSNG